MRAQTAPSWCATANLGEYTQLPCIFIRGSCDTTSDSKQLTCCCCWQSVPTYGYALNATMNTYLFEGMGRVRVLLVVPRCCYVVVCISVQGVNLCCFGQCGSPDNCCTITTVGPVTTRCPGRSRLRWAVAVLSGTSGFTPTNAGLYSAQMARWHRGHRFNASSTGRPRML